MSPHDALMDEWCGDNYLFVRNTPGVMIHLGFTFEVFERLSPCFTPCGGAVTLLFLWLDQMSGSLVFNNFFFLKKRMTSLNVK